MFTKDKAIPEDMALSTLAKEQENFLRYAILIVDHSKEALQDLVELNLKNKHLTFNEFLNQNQHEIYHLCYDSRCCQCQNTPPRRKRIIFPSQLELLFDKYNKLPSHTAIGHNDFCCSYAKVGITSQVLDLSLARCVLVNCCLDVFWFTCLTSPDQTLEQFLNSNKHIIYHLWKNNQNCCQCPSGFIFPCDRSIITEQEWKSMFSSLWSPCKNDRKRMSTGSSSVCSVGATPGIDTKDINPEIQRYIIQKCSHMSKAVDFLVEQRNLRFAHVPEAKISDGDFKLYLTDIETHLLEIARVCGKETHVKKSLRDLHLKPLSINMLSKYEKLLHKNMEAINKNVKSEHQKTRKNVSYKLRHLENRIESLEMSSIEIKEEVQGLRKLITDRFKRSQLIRETSAEIDNHRKDQAYTVVKAITACVQMLDNSKVLILSGREGSGKSRNSLEILRQMKEKDPETDVIKLKRLTQFTDIIDRDKMTIVLFEDVFGRTRKQFCEDTDVQILDSVNSYVNLGIIKVIFVMRNTVKQECKSILSSHEIFCKPIAYLDLNSKEFGLSLKEKEQIFINYCIKNRIEIIYKKEPSYPNVMEIKIDKIKVSIVDEPNVPCRSSADNTCIVFNSWSVEHMIRSDPYQGFPQYCRLFTQNKKLTTLGAHFFKYPLKSLLQEIESMRMEGLDNSVKGLKYVMLVYILLNQAFPVRGLAEFATEIDYFSIPAINENNIDVQAHQKLFNDCYNAQFGLKLHDIMNLYKELTCKYLTRKDNKIYFQHRALQDSVLISYSKTNPKATIPLLSIVHITDLVRTQNYIEQEDEIVIKISKSNYYELAKKLISLMNSQLYDRSYCDRIMESKIFTEHDEDLIYDVISCINNEFDTSSPWSSFNAESYICHYFPLYLLRNIGKLDDKTLTVNHTKNQMLISVTIGDKNLRLRVCPSISLLVAFGSKYIDIIKWLIKNTDHLLINFENLYRYRMMAVALTYVECVQFLVENVKHDRIVMTQLFLNVCYCSNNEEKHAIDWMVDNVDNSIIDYDKCKNEMFEFCNLETSIDSILYIVNKKRHVRLNINDVVLCCHYGSIDVMEKVLQNVDPELFEKEEFINNMNPRLEDNEDCWNKIVELTLPRMKYSDFNRFVEKADNYRWYGVLELLIIHVIDFSIDIVQLIEKIFTCWDEVEEEEEEREYYEHIENVFRLLLKYHTDSIGVAEIIMEKACHVGSHNVVEELLLDRFDNISYYLNITLDECLSRRFDEISFINYGGYGNLLMLFIQRVDNQFIDLNSLMSDLCIIGHSSAVLWLLENKHSHSFDLKNIMNKASYHGDCELVEYLEQKYIAGNFDYKIAMIKACRNSEKETLDVCKWLWENIDRSVFDMKAALNNASRCDNTKVINWILTDIDKVLYDTESAILFACENGEDNTVELLLDISCVNMIDIQSAMIIACRNEDNGLSITELLYECADHSTIDINVVFSAACKNLRIDIVQWIIETCDQNITVTETRDGNKHLIKSLDKKLIDIDRAFTCILNMDTPDQNKENDNETKNKLVRLILNKSDPSIIHIYKLLAETCKNDWVDIFQWILERVDNASLNIGEIINVACHNGAFDIIKWSLENIDIQLIDVDNVMVELCGFGWLECVVLIWKHCDQYKLQEAMTEACTYGRLHIAEWLLTNAHCLFDIPMLLQEAGRNGWIKMFSSLLQYFHFDKCDMHNATSQALENGHLEIAELVISTIGKDWFNCSSFSENIYMGANKESVVKFILHNIDHRSIDIATIMTNACLFGWKDVATFIVDNDLASLCDLSFAFNTACDNGELEIAQLLLDQVDHHILTTVDKAMHSVAVKGWDEIAVLLLDTAEHTRLDIGNAFMEACRHGEIDVVQAILRKVDTTMIDVETALNKACENHMHEELVLWILENIDEEQVDFTTVKKQAVRHKWRKVQFALTKVGIEDLNQVEQETETDDIVSLQ